MVDAVISLRKLQAGRKARIQRLVGRDEQIYRLEELGLRNGAVVEVFRSGNPCIIRMTGNKLCLRSDANLDVLVCPES